MFKRIMVGLDGSEHALRAAKLASELAAQSGAELHLVTVTKPYKVTPALRQYLEAENLLGEPKYVLGEMTKRIISDAKEIAEEAGVKSIKTEVKEGKPARSLVEYAKNKDMDLVVVGSRGVGDPEALLLGSVSQKVSLLVDCACLIIR